MSTLLTVKEASEYLGVSVQRIRTLCRNDSLEARLYGNTWLIEKKSIMKNKKAEIDISDRKCKLAPTKPIALSFFSGAMGMDLGIEKSGFQTVLACENEPSARKTIIKNKPDIGLIGDIRNYSAEEIMNFAGLTLGDEVDLIMGGPPCQAFSTAGKRQGLDDERGNVFLKYLDVISQIKPKYFIIENVRGLLSAPLKHRPHEQRGMDYPPLKEEEQAGGVMHYVLRIIKGMGYSVTFELYNSANFGVPQVRERVVITCARSGKKIPYLEPTHSQTEEHGLKKWTTFREAVSDLKGIEHTYINFPEKRLKYYRMLGPGQYWKNLPVELQKEALGKSFFSGGGKTGFLRRISWDKPAPTLVTHPAMPATDLSHPEELRPLSIEEYKKVQQFPDDWDIQGKILEVYKQIGNAVPVGLGFAIGKTILNFENEEPHKNYEGFKYSRYKNTSDETFLITA